MSQDAAGRIDARYVRERLRTKAETVEGVPVSLQGRFRFTTTHNEIPDFGRECPPGVQDDLLKCEEFSGGGLVVHRLESRACSGRKGVVFDDHYSTPSLLDQYPCGSFPKNFIPCDDGATSYLFSLDANLAVGLHPHRSADPYLIRGVIALYFAQWSPCACYAHELSFGGRDHDGRDVVLDGAGRFDGTNGLIAYNTGYQRWRHDQTPD